MDFFDIFIDDTTWTVALEVVLRCVIMFMLVIACLRLSGKRGIRQLSIFELAIILCLGSAAGDAMLTKELPLIEAFIVLAVILALYRITTWSMVRSKTFEALLEGMSLYVVENGVIVVKDIKREVYSHDEFFSELRQKGVEHLGQVRTALLESDGTLSILFFKDDEVKWGLPIFPKACKKVSTIKSNTFYSCMRCGETVLLTSLEQNCPRCHYKSWAESLNHLRTA